MADIGFVALVIALAASLYTTFAFVAGARTRSRSLVESGRNGLIVTMGLVTFAVGVLLYSMLTHDFSIAYVADYTSRDMAPVYIISALWAGNSGSLLTWAWLVTIFASVFLLARWRTGNRKMAAYASAVSSFTAAFFLVLLLAVANPFAGLGFTATAGSGLNPLLENPGMLFHPISLLAGYVGLTIPFAIALGALASRKLDNEWVISARTWTLVAWIFLSVGNLLGMWWAYVELGWGGYWAWDPVENASLMPWLVATALLHSLSMQRRRGTFRMWSVSLVILAFLLTIFGTFLTRSGILSSVHAFPDTGIGPYFMTFMVLAGVVAMVLAYRRRRDLVSEGQEESVVSREGAFLFNNLLLVGVTLVTFLGTMFPWISKVLGGSQVEVGKAFFDRVNTPLFLLIVFLSGICTTIGWRKASGRNLMRNLLLPLIAAAVIAAVAFVAGVRSLGVVCALFAAAFVVATIVYEWSRGVRGRTRSSGENPLVAFWRLIGANRPRYGGYIVHLGLVVMTVGIAASSLYSSSKDVVLKTGGAATVGSYTLVFNGLENYQTPRRQGKLASLAVLHNGSQAGGLTAVKFYDPRQQVRSEEERQWVTEVAIRSTAVEDLYVILSAWDNDGNVSFKLLVNPLVTWVWAGGTILVLGGILAFWPGAVAAATAATAQTRKGGGR
jgi:cytochrome c-type biogenesis protein CcmF